MKKYIGICAIIGLVIMNACSNVQLDDFNSEAWKNDKWGCETNRKESVNAILIQQDKLRGLSQSAIIKILGKPDKHELYDRNQHIFFYYIEPHQSCDSTANKPKYLNVRFSALNQASEFIVLE
jgi:outer membrane protein assembly factor BamE (lipoprotein component of BamABCDE complex)